MIYQVVIFHRRQNNIVILQDTKKQAEPTKTKKRKDLVTHTPYFQKLPISL